MAIRISNSFINTVRPGSYFDVKVKSTPVGVASSGNILIIGEADSGPSSNLIDPVNGVLLKDNFYTPDQLSNVEALYGSGPIVDSFRALSSPSGDTNITGSANNIYIVKTNVGTKASASIASGYGTLFDKNFGINGNKYNYQIVQSIAESAPEVTGLVITAFGASLDNVSFTVRLDGGAESVITLGVGGHTDINTLVTELNGLLPTGLSAGVGSAADTLKIFRDVDTAANSKGYGKTFELIDSTVGDLAKLGHSEGLYTSSAEPEVQINIKRQDIGLNEQLLASAKIGLEIGYQGTTATVTISDSILTTTVTGGSGANLSLNLGDFNTISDLADYISSQTGYSAIADAQAAQKNPIDLDDGTYGICSTNGNLPGRIKIAAASFKNAIAQSTALDFSPSASAGLPDVMATVVFLSGGAKGATSGANIVEALTDAETIDVNFVIPLFSRDATDDISEGLTDSASTYTIDAVNASVKNHVLKMSTAKIKKHRIGAASFWGSYKDAKTKAGILGHARMIFFMQKSSQVSSTGDVVNYLPWHSASIAIGMQAAGFYKSITNKFANIISFQDPSGFDSGSPGQIEDAIESGICFLEKSSVGSKWVVDQTTYGLDSNFVYNSLQAVYAADLVALDLAQSFQTSFVGQSLADVEPSIALSFLTTKMNLYKAQKLIAGSSDAPLGFKNAKVSINGPIMEISVEIKLATTILFIPINIEISQVQGAA